MRKQKEVNRTNPQSFGKFIKMNRINYQFMTRGQVGQLQEIDRSEHIDLVYEVHNGELVNSEVDYECGNWDAETLAEIKSRFLLE